MVNFEIPKHYTSSPSSYDGAAAQLTVNHEATVDLDSSNAFEGPEKLLEVWFSPSPTTLPPSAAPNGLKSVGIDAWKDMLDLVHCRILSVIEHDQVDAYLLSESSMFVFPHKLVLKTCGTTTLLCGLPRMLEIAALSAGFPHAPADLLNGIAAAANPFRVFYSRKNFQFPDKQRGPHRSWRDEVRFLDRLFNGGSAYMIGRMNGEHWYLYITGPDADFTTSSAAAFTSGTETKCIDVPANCAAALVAASCDVVDDNRDETLEVLMTDLDESKAKQFYVDDASVVLQGRFLSNHHDERKTSSPQLGTASGHCRSLGSNSSDEFDVFEQTLSVDRPNYQSANNAADPSTLQPAVASEGHALGTIVAESCGLIDVYPPTKYPEAHVDAYLFTPCGFSANGVVPAPSHVAATSKTASNSFVGGESRGTHYYTIHVTPEPQCSYASFETNVPSSQSGRETADIVEQLVHIFQPGRFSVTLFEGKASNNLGNGSVFGREASGRSGTTRMDRIPGYRRVDRIVHDLDGYDLVFRHYERHDWKGGAPRLGEAGS